MNEFSMKELYSVQLKATSNIEIGGRTFIAGETILNFDELQLSVIAEQKIIKTAKGGYGNADLISWDTTSSVAFVGEYGTMSQIGLAIISNSKLAEARPDTTEISYEQTLESNDSGVVKLKYIALRKEFFVYDETGKLITGYELTDSPDGYTIVSKLSPFKNYSVKYIFIYTGKSEIMSIGYKLFNGYFKMTARMRLKDDTTGLIKTGILEIPRLKITSDLSMRLGIDVPPMVSTFRMQGDPVGERNKQYVCKITYLDSDIDSDL